MDISEAVAKAAETLSEGAGEEVEVLETRAGEAVVKEPKTKEEDVKPEDSALAERTAQALELLSMLEDPQQGAILIENLAKRAGLLKAETREEKREALDDFDQLLKEELGDEYSFLTEKLSNTFRKFALTLRAETDTKLAQLSQVQIQAEATRRADSFLKEQKVTEKEAAAIYAMGQKFPPNPQVPVEEYLQVCLKVVRSEQTEAATKVAKAEKVAANLRGRTATLGVDDGDETVKLARPKTVTIKDAVAAAARGESWE